MAMTHGMLPLMPKQQSRSASIAKAKKDSLDRKVLIQTVRQSIEAQVFIAGKSVVDVPVPSKTEKAKVIVSGKRSLEAAMPTVFTSGTILTICGFVVGIIASQASISQVGFLLGKGTLVSVLMITLVLPSVLYLLDGFILKLSMKKKQ